MLTNLHLCYPIAIPSFNESVPWSKFHPHTIRKRTKSCQKIVNVRGNHKFNLTIEKIGDIKSGVVDLRRIKLNHNMH